MDVDLIKKMKISNEHGMHVSADNRMNESEYSEVMKKVLDPRGSNGGVYPVSIGQSSVTFPTEARCIVTGTAYKDGSSWIFQRETKGAKFDKMLAPMAEFTINCLI